MEKSLDPRHLVLRSAAGAEVPVTVAGLGGRSLAFLVDWHIRLLIAVCWFAATIGVALAAGSEERPYLLIWVWLPAAAVYLLYHPVLEVLFGRTPGKKWAGLRIVTRDGHRPTAGALLLRNIFRIIDSLPAYYVIGIFTVLFNRNALRIGDIAAGTLLVYEEKSAPVQLEAVLGNAETEVAVPLRALVADLLERWKGLDQTIRLQMAERILAAQGLELPGGANTERRDWELRRTLNRMLHDDPPAAVGSADSTTAAAT